MIELCVDNASVDSIDFSENYENLKEIEYFDSKKLPYSDFYNRFLIPNIPCVIVGISEKWECKNWIRNDQIDFDYIAKKLGHIKVPVTNCSISNYDCQEKSTIFFEDFVNYWRNRRQKDDLLYLKDWHLKNEVPAYDFYRVPEYFGSDWLNEYLLDTKKDDYRFVYIGVKGSW
jgi:hypothetical protein